MKIPKVISTSEIFDDISVLTRGLEDQVQIIMDGKKEIGIFAPLPLFESLTSSNIL